MKPSLVIGLLCLVGLSACSLVRTQAAVTPTMNVTQAFETVSAQLTSAALQTSSPLSQTQAPTTLPTTALPSPTNTPAGTTPAPASSPTVGIPCDVVVPGSPIDVTVEDNTIMQPGQDFTKTWRLVNGGTCTWTRQYRAVWFSGEKFAEGLSVPLGQEVAPGGSVLVSVDMSAPSQAGTYRSNWKLANANGELFGIGLSGSDPVYPFYVQIIVEQPPTPTVTATVPEPTATVTAPGPSTTPPVSGTVTTTPPATEATATPAVLASGAAALSPGGLLDLDSNTVNPPAGQDLGFQEDASHFHWLAPQNSAALGIYGSSAPGLGSCQAAGLGSAPVAVESLQPGIFLCYRTDQGHFGWLRYDSFNSGDSSIQLTISTWGTP